MFDLSSTESTEAIKEKFVANDEYGVILWYQGSSESTVFEVLNEDGDSKLSLVRQSDGYFRLDSISLSRTVNVIAEGSPISDNILYGIVVNYICNSKGKYITLTVLDSTTFDTIQENSTSTFDKLLPTTEINISGGNQQIANLRVKKLFVSKQHMKNILVDRLPSVSEYYVINNNVPEVIGEKLKPI